MLFRLVARLFYDRLNPRKNPANRRLVFHEQGTRGAIVYHTLPGGVYLDGIQNIASAERFPSSLAGASSLQHRVERALTGRCLAYYGTKPKREKPEPFLRDTLNPDHHFGPNSWCVG